MFKPLQSDPRDDLFAMDEKTKSTALDAFACKYSACKLNYLRTGPFLEAVKGQLETPAARFQKRSCIMHRGYCARVLSQQETIDAFLEATQGSDLGRQIVFLGSGFDTLSLDILADLHQSGKGMNDLRIFEVDFPDLIQRKGRIYKETRTIYSFLQSLSSESSTTASPASSTSEINVPTDTPMMPPPAFLPKSAPSASTDTSSHLGPLHLIGADLRDPSSLSQLLQLSITDYRPTSPTLFITECVLVYLSPEATNALVSTLSNPPLMNPSTSALWITYDMIRPDDTYGKMMQQNLRRAGFQLPGFLAYPTLAAQCERFTHNHLTAPQQPAATQPQRQAPQTALPSLSEEIEEDEANEERSSVEAAHGNAAVSSTIVSPATVATQPTDVTTSTQRWTEAYSLDMLTAYRVLVSHDERTRIAHLEPLDEIEEWQMLMGHYSLTIAHKSSDSTTTSSGGKRDANVTLSVPFKYSQHPTSLYLHCTENTMSQSPLDAAFTSIARRLVDFDQSLLHEPVQRLFFAPK